MRLLIATDLPASHAVLDIAARSEAELILLHVTRERPALSVLARLYSCSSSIRERGLEPKLRALQGELSVVVCAEAESRSCDLIVIGASSAPGKILKRSTVPVLAIRNDSCALWLPLGSRFFVMPIPSGPLRPWLESLTGHDVRNATHTRVKSHRSNVAWT